MIRLKAAIGSVLTIRKFKCLCSVSMSRQPFALEPAKGEKYHREIIKEKNGKDGKMEQKREGITVIS